MPKENMDRNNLEECCICLEKKSILVELIDAPCKNPRHSACNSCLKRIIKSIPISYENPRIKCQYPFSECRHEYSKKMIKEILRNKYPLYKAASLQYSNEDSVIRSCKKCNYNIIIPETEMSYMGENIFLCEMCLEEVCIDCGSRISPDEPNCIVCEDLNLYTNPSTSNYYFYKKDNKKNIVDYLLKNDEVTPRIALEQIEYRINLEDDIYVVCPICNISLKKSEQCNGIQHCHVEICYSCGMFSEIGKSLVDHWSATGDRGCPRWDTDLLWKKEIPLYECVDNVCHGQDQGDCKIKDHEEGIFLMQEYRKKQHMYHSLKSLLPITRYKTLLLLPDYLKKYFPEMKIWDNLDSNLFSIKIRKDYILK